MFLASPTYVTEDLLELHIYAVGHQNSETFIDCDSFRPVLLLFAISGCHRKFHDDMLRAVLLWAALVSVASCNPGDPPGNEFIPPVPGVAGENQFMKIEYNWLTTRALFLRFG